MGTSTPNQVTEFTVDAAADAVVDKAMAAADVRLSRDERDELRHAIQDAVDALIDQCRAFYRADGARSAIAKAEGR